MGLFKRAPDPGPPGICPACWDSKRITPHCANGKCGVWRCGNCRRRFTRDPARSVDAGLVPPWEPPAHNGPFVPPGGFTNHPKDPNDRLDRPFPPPPPLPPPPKETP